MALSNIPPTFLSPESAECNIESVQVRVDGESEPPTPDGTGLPPNFAEVLPGLYRSSYPSTSHFNKLEEYRLKTIVTLVGQEYPAANRAFMERHGIKHHQIPLPAHKELTDAIPNEDMVKVLLLILDPRNYPLLIHCNKGKHRTGCTIACFRKMMGWSPDMAIEEYRNYSAPKSRSLDESFIGDFDCTEVVHVARQAGFLPTLPSPPNSFVRALTNGWASRYQAEFLNASSNGTKPVSAEPPQDTCRDNAIQSGPTLEEVATVNEKLQAFSVE